MQDLTGKHLVQGIKDSIKALRKEIRESRIHEGLMMNSIFNFKNQLSSHERGKNHLFDDVGGEYEKDSPTAGDFTEDDLKDASDNRQTEDEFKVKSVPHKLSVVKQKDDPYNPYTNQNLDADLTTTIGKLHKKKQKHTQINTSAFIMA